MLKQNTRVLLGTGVMPLIFESGSQNHRMGNDHNPPHQSHNTESGHLPNQSEAAGHGESSLQSKTSSNGRNGENGDDDGAEADNVEEDDRDEDGVAPSGCTIDKDGNQAGHIMSAQGPVSGGRKGKRGQSNPDDRASSKVPRLTHEIGKTVEGPDDEDEMWLNPFSDDEESDQNIEQLEEENIIESEEILLAAQSPFIPSPGWNSSDDVFFNGLFEEELRRDDRGFLGEGSGLDPFPSMGFYDEIPYSPINFHNGTQFPNSPPHDTTRFPSPPRRRVHFEEMQWPSATGSSTESLGLDGETDGFLTPPRDGLESSSRERMEIEQAIHAQEERKPESPHQAFKRGRLTFEHAASIEQDTEDSKDSKDSDGSCGSSSGYETDLGETTDEEEIPPPLLPARPSSSTALPLSSTVPPRPILPHSLFSVAGYRGPPVEGYPFPEFLRQEPPMGSWIADPTKPFAYSDRNGIFRVVHPQKKPKKSVPKVPETPVSGRNTTIVSPRASLPRFVSTEDSDERPSIMGSLRGGYIFGVQTPKPENDEDSLEDAPVVDDASDGSNDGQDDKDVFSEFLEDYEDGSLFRVTFADSDDDDDGDDEYLLNSEDFFTRDYSDESAGEQQLRGGTMKKCCRDSAAINPSSSTQKRKLNCSRCSGSSKHVGQSGIASKKRKLNHR